jgi:Putative Ig domain
LHFKIAGQPNWATFDTATGRLAGMPLSTQIGMVNKVTISVTDGAATSSLPTFSVAVAPSNGAPTIGGIPPSSIMAGTAFNFVPTASDANGDALSFSIANKPSWADFDTTSGRISGTPTASDVGAYSNIVISVSDAASTASMSPFSLTVADTAGGAATLSWTPPTTNTDGSSLTNLAGYRIYYGTDSSKLSRTVQVANAGVSSYVISDLSPTTWYFSVRAYSAANVESDASNLASKTIP